MHEYLGLEPDIIIMLVAFCLQIDCFSVRYMEQIAAEWAERGVTTHALVQEDIDRRTQARTYNGRIMTMFEMPRTPTARQQEFIDEWRQNGYSFELIKMAYERNRNQKGDKLDFSYINGILKRWFAAGVRTPEQAEAADQAYHAAQRQKKQAESDSPAAAGSSSIDMDEIEKLMNPYQ
jgi:DnaD/phage-associated family protein